MAPERGTNVPNELRYLISKISAGRYSSCIAFEL